MEWVNPATRSRSILNCEIKLVRNAELYSLRVVGARIAASSAVLVSVRSSCPSSRIAFSLAAWRIPSCKSKFLVGAGGAFPNGNCPPAGIGSVLRAGTLQCQATARNAIAIPLRQSRPGFLIGLHRRISACPDSFHSDSLPHADTP